MEDSQEGSNSKLPPPNPTYSLYLSVIFFTSLIAFPPGFQSHRFYLSNLSFQEAPCMLLKLPFSQYKWHLKTPTSRPNRSIFSSLLPSLSAIEKMKQLCFPTLLLVSLLVTSIFLQTTVAGPPSEPPPSAKPAPPTKPPAPQTKAPAPPTKLPAPPTKAPAPPTKPNPSFCDSKCGARCANAGVYDRCVKYCGICCTRCKCVPSGTYGNKSECPCYRDKLNSKGKPKCP